jgi:hypothetical protein
MNAGRRDLVSCTWNDEADVPTFSDYSNKEYQEKIGLKGALAKRKEWLHEAGPLEELTRLSSANAPCLGRVKSLRFSQHRLRQRPMFDICKRVASPGKDFHCRLVVDLRPEVVAFWRGQVQ